MLSKSTGIGYSSLITDIDVVPRGMNGAFSARVSLTKDTKIW